MKLKVKVTFFFFQKYAGKVTKVTKRGKNDQLFPPLKLSGPHSFGFIPPSPETHHPAPYKASDSEGRKVDRIFFFL